MIVCPRCSKENQDHYKFCLGCGAELPRDQAQPKSFTAPTPPSGVPAVGGGAFGEPAAQPAPPPPEPEGPKSCPNCSSDVPPNFKFCGSCGHDMTKVSEPAPAAAPAASAPAASAPAETAAAPAPAASAAAAAPAPGTERGRLVLIRPDGSEGESFPLGETTKVGRDSAGPFASDSYLSPVHAEFAFGADGLRVTDLESLNGVYVRIDRDTPTELIDGAVFRVGQEILVFEAYGADQTAADGTVSMGGKNHGCVGRVRLVIGRESFGNSYPIPSDGIHLGRERGDIIFPEDGYVSGLHARVHGEGGKVFLTDVGSSNGTFVRVAGGRPLSSGMLLLMGQQLFRVEY